MAESASSNVNASKCLKNAFETWYLKDYFEFVSKSDKNLSVKCKLCLPLPKVLSTAYNSTSNLKKHLEVFNG
jgi:hypothetical protein